MSTIKVEAHQRLLITIAVMSSTIMQVLDTTIVNVALPHMQGQLGATRDQISWVLTSYLVASGIFMPLTGYFTDRLGQKRYLMLSVAGFVVSSALCGLSTNIPEIVFFRLAQGVFGAALVPLSQSIMVNTYPLEQRGKAMAIWGMGVMIGPILGPTLGGYLTEILSWRWTFYINVPVGILSLLLTWHVIPETKLHLRRMDWKGFILMGLTIGATQYVLDRGNEDAWFSSNTILFLTALAILGFISFIIHAIRAQDRAIFRLGIFRDRNFMVASLLITVFGLGLYGTTLVQPLMLEGLMSYPALTTGLVMAPRGLASMFSMMIVGKLISRIDARILISLGIILASAGAWAMTLYNLDINIFWSVWPVVMQGLGMGLIFVPMSTVAFSSLPLQDSAEAAGLFSLLRTIGSSIGISIVSTIQTRHTQIAWNQLGGHIMATNPATNHYLQGLNLNSDSPTAPLILGHLLQRQADMTGYLDAFFLITWGFLIMLPLVMLMHRIDLKGSSA